MVLVDTSVWIEHFRRGEPGLVELLDGNGVLMHPFVRGELSCGNLRERGHLLAMMGDLPAATAASDEEVLGFIEHHRLMESGIGYIDAHLLASAALSAGAGLWTRDRVLQRKANEMNLCWTGAGKIGVR